MVQLYRSHPWVGSSLSLDTRPYCSTGIPSHIASVRLLRRQEVRLDFSLDCYTLQKSRTGATAYGQQGEGDARGGGHEPGNSSNAVSSPVSLPPSFKKCVILFCISMPRPLPPRHHPHDRHHPCLPRCFGGKRNMQP